MKLILSQTEVAAIVRQHFNLSNEVTIAIDDAHILPPPPAVNHFLQLVAEVDALMIRKDSIGAIKTYRRFGEKIGRNVSVWEGKMAIDFWDLSSSIIMKQGRLPIITRNSNGQPIIS